MASYILPGNELNVIQIAPSVGTPLKVLPLQGQNRIAPGIRNEPLNRFIALQNLEDLNCIQLLDKILQEAVHHRVSDIHVECRENDVRLRFRIDGVMYPAATLANDIHPQLLSRIKILAGMDIAEKRLPQDGRFTYASRNGKVDCRVSTLPTIQGEKAVIRILDRAQAITELKQLGLSARNLHLLRCLSQRSHGLLLVTGPTGSGKTSTLYALLHHINTADRNIITLEDPVEYSLENINQVQINPKAGLRFASGLRSALRQDPDVIMVGEIRDEETAQLAVHAALTGHLVLSTLHTNSAAAAVARLLDMGCEPYLLASALSGIVAQRLVRLLCPLCRQDYIVGENETAWLKWPGVCGQPFYQPIGCSHCYGLGYKGRTAIQEVMAVGTRLKKAIYAGARSEEEMEDLAISNHMVPIKQDGIDKARQGFSSLEEVVRVINQDSEREES
ncbi:MAG: GspE/PulE family protein [Syntrophomonadaceae bacterium]|jgi:type IV pilus assembly protein PilB